jgi:hypothetical protein
VRDVFTDDAEVQVVVDEGALDLRGVGDPQAELDEWERRAKCAERRRHDVHAGGRARTEPYAIRFAGPERPDCLGGPVDRGEHLAGLVDEQLTRRCQERTAADALAAPGFGSVR